MVTIAWALGWLDGPNSMIKFVVEVAEAFQTVLSLLGKLLGT